MTTIDSAHDTILSGKTSEAHSPSGYLLFTMNLLANAASIVE